MSAGEPNWEAIEEVGQLPKERRAPAGDGVVNAEPPPMGPPRVPAGRWIR